jgi:hypothetical protein
VKRSRTRAYLWHNRFSVLSLDISKWHCCTLVLVDTEFWIIDEWDVIKRNCTVVSKHLISIFISLLFSCTTSLVTLTAVSVVICFGPRRRPSNPFFLNSEVLSRIRQMHNKLPKIYIPRGGSSPNQCQTGVRLPCVWPTTHLIFLQIGTHRRCLRLLD